MGLCFSLKVPGVQQRKPPITLTKLLGKYIHVVVDSQCTQPISGIYIYKSLKIVIPKRQKIEFDGFRLFILCVSYEFTTYMFYKRILLIQVYWCPTRFQYMYQKMSMSFNSNKTGITRGAGTTDLFRSTLWVSCCSNFSFLCNILQIVVCSLVLCPLYCLSWNCIKLFFRCRFVFSQQFQSFSVDLWILFMS